MKTALWVLLIWALLAIVFYFLPSVDFAGAETVFAAAADGKALSHAPTLNRRGGAKRWITSPAPSFCCILWVDGGDPLLNWPNTGGKPRPGMKLVGDSLKDTVIESEGGRMPSQEDFQKRGPMKEGESHPAESGGLLPDGPDSTQPRPPDAGGPGRVLVPAEPGPLLSAWGFVAWLPDGQLFKRAGGLFDDPDACAQARAARRQQAPDLRLSACTRLEIGERETL